MKFRISRKKVLTPFIHLIGWGALFIFPFLVQPDQGTEIRWMITRNWLPLIQFAIVFYLNYLLLADRYFFNKKYVPFFLLNILLIGLLLLANQGIRSALMDPGMPGSIPPDIPGAGHHGKPGYNGGGRPPFIRFFFFMDIFPLMIPVVFAIAVKATENWIRSESEKKEIENRNLISELQSLRYQLQPHFFFNSLNNIYSLVEVSPARAQEAIHDLSKLMRYLLYDTGREKVELSQEIFFLQNYIRLMELRQTSNIITRFEFPEIPNTRYYVAPLLFISLIENAFKHGVSATQASVITFTMTVNDQFILFKSENTNFPKNQDDKSGSGIGLTNLKKRLDLLYPGKHELNTDVSGDLYIASLRLDF
ncbi:MAG: sensor histidine kinase [Bacteroidota bacterium]